MRVNTISMKLSLRIEQAGVKDGNIVMNGFAGAMPCETIISPEAVVVSKFSRSVINEQLCFLKRSQISQKSLILRLSRESSVAKMRFTFPI